MVFSGLVFLFLFLPVFFLVYFFVPGRAKNVVLLLASLVFYGWGEPLFLTVMVFSIFSDYVHGILVDKYLRHEDEKKAKIALISSIVINLGMLFLFKYTGLLPLPIGISFYTFQTMSYTIDVYRREVKVQKNLLDFSVFVTLFPQLVAGPIVKYKDVEADLGARSAHMEQVGYGIYRFVVGLAKKVILANNIGMLWEYAYGTVASERTVLLAWLGAVAFALQIYFDFSGYSDMAIGIGAMLGFHFPENFNYPYIATSVTDFWRRWHISLSSWFREYVYIPLGGNRKGLGRQLVNILIVWLLTGIWHGAGFNFVAWGLWFALFLVIEKSGFLRLLKRLPKVFGLVYTWLVVLISWVFFATDSFASAFDYIRAMFGFGADGLVVASTGDLYQLSNYWVLLLLGAVFAIPHKKKWHPVFLVLLFVVSVAYIVDASYNPFLYFRF